MPKLNLSPAMRLAIGLALMSACLFVVLDLATGLVPDPAKPAARARLALAESIATRLAHDLDEAAPGQLHRLLQTARGNDPEIVATTVRSLDGEILAATGDVDRKLHWSAADRSTLNRILIPIDRNRSPWGQLEVQFTPVYPTTIEGWLTQPMVLTLAGLCVIGSFLYYLYLRRALQYLDPSSAVPERVRAAFDTLAEGVVVLDKDGRIVLANQMFRDLAPIGTPDFYGKPAADLGWLTQTLTADGGELPWAKAMRKNRTIERYDCSLISVSGDGVRRFTVRANPISDASGLRRGCIVTFDDVSQLHRTNEALTEALENLKSSQTRIQSQNESLQRLASRDPLTDCLNRRAFFDTLRESSKAWSDQGRSVGVAMLDIDFFKRVNDQHGHGVGDQVLREMATVLRSMVRPDDLLCRMGGEEFCIVWNGSGTDQFEQRAEQIRNAVATAPPIAVGKGELLRITMSVGLACDADGSVSVDLLLERADKALYQAKRTGRNRVVRWPLTSPDFVHRQHNSAAPADRR